MPAGSTAAPGAGSCTKATHKEQAKEKEERERKELNPAAARRIFSLAKGAVPLAVPGETRAETSMTDVTNTPTAETPDKRKRKVGVSADLASRNWTAFSLMPDGSTKYGEISGNLED